MTRPRGRPGTYRERLEILRKFVEKREGKKVTSVKVVFEKPKDAEEVLQWVANKVLSQDGKKGEWITLYMEP